MVKSKSFCQFSPALQIKTEQTGNIAVCLLLMMGFWDSNWNFQKSYFGVRRICQTAKPNRKEHTWILFPSSQPLIMVWGEWGLELDKILNLVLLPMPFTPSHLNGQQLVQNVPWSAVVFVHEVVWPVCRLCPEQQLTLCSLPSTPHLI